MRHNKRREIRRSVVINHISRLPMIHIKNHITITKQEIRMVEIITDYTTQEHMWVHTINQTKYLSGSTSYIYIYKIVIVTTCQFNQPTRPMRST